MTDNNQTRTLFRQTIADMFGGESKIPKSVKKAMRNKISKAVKSFPDGFPFEYEESGAARFELSIRLKSTLN